MMSATTLVRLTGAAALAALAIVAMPAGAQAYGLVHKGNDTGGIISWQNVADLPFAEVKAIAAAHCGYYDKVAIIRSVHKRYGDYVSFSCEWRPVGSLGHPLRVAY